MSASTGKLKNRGLAAVGTVVLLIAAAAASQVLWRQRGWTSSHPPPVPAPTTVQPPLPPQGLPIQRKTLMAELNLHGWTFNFKPTNPVRGFPAYRAANGDELPVAEIIGDGPNPAAASLLVAFKVKHGDSNERQEKLMETLLGAVLPGWSERSAWLRQEIPNARSRGRATVSLAGIDVDLDHVRKPGVAADLYVLTVSTYPFPFQP